MIRFLTRFVLVVALAGLVAWLADRPGVVRIDWLDHRIEAPLGLSVLAILVGVAALLWLAFLIRRILRAPGSVSYALRRRRDRRGFESLSRGMIAIGAGDLPSARRHAQIAERLLNDEPLARLLAVQAAQAAGDTKRVTALFESMRDTKETELLGLRGLFNQARQAGDLTRAGKIAGEALKIRPGLPWASNAILMLQSAEKNWRGAAETLDGLRRSGALDEKTVNRKRAVVLTGEAADKERTAPLEAVHLALRAHKLDATLVPAAVIAARLYASQGQARKAARIIERTFAHNPHVDLVAVYAHQRPGAAPRERLKKAEQLVTRFGGGEEGAVGIAQAAIAAFDWERAKAVLEPFAEERPRARVCALLAEIAEGQGDKGLAREWLARGMRAPPDPKWTANGVVSDQWQPVSPVTGELGAFEWKVPVERLSHEVAGSEIAQAASALAAPDPKPAAAEQDGIERGSEAVEAGQVRAMPPLPASENKTIPTERAPLPEAAEETKPAAFQNKPVPFPLPDDPGPQREEESAVPGAADDWARRLAGSS